MDIKKTVDADIRQKKIQLDNSCKKLLSEKQILAHIMKRCTDEFRSFSIDDIIAKCIAPSPDINLGDANDDQTGIIVGNSQEEVTLPDVKNFYDIKFDATVPSKNNSAIQMIMNIEAQNRSYLTYNISTRGIFYGGTLISGQYGTIFTKSHYELIRKVYSIWICTKPRKADRNSITKFSISKKGVLGKFKARKKQYDLMEVIIICLPTTPNSTKDKLLDMLGTMFSYGYNDKKIKNDLEEKFNVRLTPTFEEEVNKMCNLGDEIYTSALNEGISQGISHGISLGSKTMAQRINNLNIRLLKDNRLDDLQKSAKDAAYQEKLLKYFNI